MPQINAPSIHAGIPAEVILQEFGKSFRGTIARSANALDPASRTLLTEVQAPNPGGILLPGMYAQVKLTSQRPNAPLLAAGDTLVARPDGTYVAAVISGNIVQFKNIRRPGLRQRRGSDERP